MRRLQQELLIARQAQSQSQHEISVEPVAALSISDKQHASVALSPIFHHDQEERVDDYDSPSPECEEVTLSTLTLVLNDLGLRPSPTPFTFLSLVTDSTFERNLHVL